MFHKDGPLNRAAAVVSIYIQTDATIVEHSACLPDWLRPALTSCLGPLCEPGVFPREVSCGGKLAVEEGLNSAECSSEP